MDPDTPRFQFNDQPVLNRLPTGLIDGLNPRFGDSDWPDNPSLPDVAPLLRNDKTPTFCRAMEQRLQDNRVAFPNSGNNRKSFWPGILFDHLFRDADVWCLVGELIDNSSLPINGHQSRGTAQQWWANEVCQNYRRIFALLLLTEEEKHLSRFVMAGINDSYLPLDQDSPRLNDIFGTQPAGRFLDTLCGMYQWQLGIQFFKLPPPGEVYQVELGEDSLRPWYQTRQARVSVEQTRSGAYGEVRQIKIHPWQHDFGRVLESVSPALLYY